jgi:hypothetical protein
MLLADSIAEDLEEKDLEALDSCSRHYINQNETEVIKLEKINNGNMCQVSNSTTPHPTNLDVNDNLTPIHQRKASTSTQLTWNYDKKNDTCNTTRSAQQGSSIQYADDTSSVFTQKTLTVSKNQVEFDDGDDASMKTITAQPKSVLRIAEAGIRKMSAMEIEGGKLLKSPLHAPKKLSVKDKIKNLLFTLFCAWDCWPPFVKFQVSFLTKK